MKIWRKYQNYLFDGEWHVHTNFTDGANSISEYAGKAVELGIPLLAFTEHVRKELDYDFGQFLNEINIARKKFPTLIILSGCEGKVLSDGTLDCREGILEKVDYRVFAVHSFPGNLDKYFTVLENVLINNNLDAWVHPGLFFKKHSDVLMPGEKLSKLFRLMKKAGILLEVNLRYKLPGIDWLTKYTRETINHPVVFGGDVHSVEDLCLSWKIKYDFKKHSKRMLADKIDVTAFMVWFVENYPESAKILREDPDYQLRFK